MINTYRTLVGSLNGLNPYHALNWDNAGHKIGYKICTPEETARINQESPHILTKDDKVSNWGERFEKIKNIIKCFGFIGLQEINPVAKQQLDTDPDLSKYKFTKLSLSKFSPDELIEQRIGVTIGYNIDEYELLKQKRFQLPSTSAWPRGVIVADLVHKATGKIFRVASVHLKGYDANMYEPGSVEDVKKQAQKKPGLQELQETLQIMQKESENVDVFVVTGDFNDRKNKEYHAEHSRHAEMEKNGYRYVPQNRVTEIASGDEIDYTYIKLKNPPVKVEGQVDPEELGMPVDIEQDGTASDHFAIATSLLLKA